MKNRTIFVSMVILLAFIVIGFFGWFFVLKKYVNQEFSFTINLGVESDQLAFNENQYQSFFITKNQEKVYIFDPYSKMIKSFDFNGNYITSYVLNLNSKSILAGFDFVNNNLIINTITYTDLQDSIKSVDWYVYRQNEFIKLQQNFTGFGLNGYFNTVNIINKKLIMISNKDEKFEVNINDTSMEKGNTIKNTNEYGLNIIDKNIQNSDGVYRINVIIDSGSFVYNGSLAKIPVCDNFIVVKQEKIVCINKDEVNISGKTIINAMLFGLSNKGQYQIIQDRIVNIKKIDNYVLTLMFDSYQKKFEVRNINLESI